MSWKRVLVILILLVFFEFLFWMTYEQAVRELTLLRID